MEYVTYELVLASPAVSGVSGSSNLYSFRDGRQVAVQLASRGVLSPGLVQYCSQHSSFFSIAKIMNANRSNGRKWFSIKTSQEADNIKQKL